MNYLSYTDHIVLITDEKEEEREIITEVNNTTSKIIFGVIDKDKRIHMLG